MKRMVCWAIMALAVSTPVAAQEWEVGHPPFKAKDSSLTPTVSFNPTNGTISLANRGCIVSSDEWEKFVLTTSWKWTEGQEQDAYQDVLAIAFGSDGSLSEKWSHEATNGLRVAFEAHGSKATLLKAGGEVLASKEGIAFSRGTAYNIRIHVDGKKVFVDVDGKSVLEADLPTGTKGKVAIYNREPVAAVRKVSVLRDLKITAQ
ncbi:MAG: hypothetical protein HYS13_13760 [Planctomycetia bacterium]|nr:hypothetical protein [Planctomycetia bacterium]